MWLLQSLNRCFDTTTKKKKIVESWCNQYKITGELELIEIVQREESHNFVFKTVCVLTRFRTEYISLVKLT